MKVKYIFESKKYGTITNDRPFIDNDDMKEKEFGGCIVTFDKTPMLQDYNAIADKLWCGQLQWNYPSAELKSITTKLIE